MNNFKLKTTSTRFILIFIFLIYFTYNAFNIDKISKWFTVGDTLDYTGLIGFYIVGLFLSISIFTILAHRYILKGFAIFVIISSAASTYFIYTYGIAIDKTMILNLWYTNTTESLGLFTTQMIPYILFFIIIPIIIVIKTEIIFDYYIKHIVKKVILFSLSIAISIAFVYLNFNAIHLAGNASKKYIAYQLVPVNFIVGIGSAVKNYIIDNYKIEAEPVNLDVKLKSNDDLIVVLAIGEAARQKSFSLYNYKRDTNPLLSKQDNLYILNGIAKYGSTIYALPEILSRDKIKLPSIADTAGVPTSCLVNLQLYGNCGTVNEVKTSNCKHGGKCYDEDVLTLLDNDLNSYTNGKKLIVLHFGDGSHGPIYPDRFPKEFGIFTPQCKHADVMNKCTKEELYNAYDNTILYIDTLLSKSIDMLEKTKKPYVIIYLSDHGESLLENGRVFHGMPPGIDLPYEQAHIPLLVKASIPIQIVKRKEYTQQDVYDTVLDLLSLEINILKKENVFIKRP